MTTDELSCAELVELVTEYLDGALAPRDGERFEEHLADCAGCRAHLDQMRSTIRATGRLGEERLPPELVGRLAGAFRGWRRAPAGSGPV